MSGMDSFRLFNEASLPINREPHPQAAAPQPSGAETAAPFHTLIEQALGVETEPDTEFFVDSWTLGIAAAKQNFLRRQQKPKNCDLEMPAWVTFSSFTPWFAPNIEAPAEVAWPQSSAADLRWLGDREGDDRQAADELIAGPLTLESARRLLGVAATSTRVQIRLAYREMASRYHPDRLAQSTPHEQKLASDRMATINEAYQLLRADQARQQSDSRIM
jgi:hypothetical protein